MSEPAIPIARESTQSKRLPTTIKMFYTRLPAFFATLLFATSSVLLFFPANIAHAETLGYPWHNAACQFGSAGGSDCHNPVDPSNKYNWGVYVNGTFQPYRNGYQYRNCTDYAQWRLSGLGGSVPPGLGNGGMWYDNSPVNKRSSTPQPGYAAVKPGAVGHVAVVESVNSNGTITISEYNGSGTGEGRVRTGTASSMGFTQFVNFGASAPLGGSGGANGTSARSDLDNNGGADLFAMVPTQNGVAGYSLVSTHQSFLNQYWWDGTGLGWNGVTPMTGDVNGDKKADLVFLTDEGVNGTKAFVALSNGSGFGTPQLWWTGTDFMFSGIKASLGDVDNNSAEDIVITTNEANGSKAFVLFSTWQGFLSPQLWWSDTGISWSGMTPMVGDTNGDKKADYIFLTNEGANGTKAFVAKSNGSSGFNAAELWHNITDMTYSGIKPTIGDVDGNGGVDLILTTNETNGSKAFALLSTWQAFLTPQLWWDGTGTSWSGMTPFTGDLNNDKKADYVFMADEGANGTKFFAATSNGSAFAAPQQWAHVVGWGYSGVKTYLK